MGYALPKFKEGWVLDKVLWKFGLLHKMSEKATLHKASGNVAPPVLADRYTK